MEVIKITDNPDGSAEIECEFTEEEVQLLLEHAVNDILRKAIENNVLVQNS